MESFFIPNPKEHLYIESSSLCNLKCKFCAYSKSKRIKKIMPTAFFQNIIDQATDFGYDFFGLTPLTGEVFVDSDFISKLQYMEEHPGVKGYSFFSNLVTCPKKFILFLYKAKKIKRLTISIYGYDPSSFKDFTRGSSAQFNNFVSNLQGLLDVYKQTRKSFELCFSIKPYFNNWILKSKNTAIDKIIDEAQLSEVIINRPEIMNNWGGYISKEDLTNEETRLSEPKNNQGPCSLIFFKNLVMADGRVNACACRDADGTMVIGDLNLQSFREIYSIQNSLLVDLVKKNLSNDLSYTCRRCDFFKSPYNSKKKVTKYRKELISLNQFIHTLLPNNK